MKMSKGGYRVGVFEAIQAPDKGEYLDKLLYAVDGLPGIWRRCKMPKGDPADAGLLACWLDGSIVYLEFNAAVNDELELFIAGQFRAADEAAYEDGADGPKRLIDELTAKRTEYLMKLAEAGAPVAPVTGAAPAPEEEPESAPHGAGSGEVDV